MIVPEDRQCNPEGTRPSANAEQRFGRLGEAVCRDVGANPEQRRTASGTERSCTELATAQPSRVRQEALQTEIRAQRTRIDNLQEMAGNKGARRKS
jgi:hypothetical protein